MSAAHAPPSTVAEGLKGCGSGLVFEAVCADRSGCVDEERLEGLALILQAIDLTIADVEARDDADSREQLVTLRCMRERWREKAEEESRGKGDAGRLRGGEPHA